MRESVGFRSVQDAEGYMVHGGGYGVQESVGCWRVCGAGGYEVQVVRGLEVVGCRRVRGAEGGGGASHPIHLQQSGAFM